MTEILDDTDVVLVGAGIMSATLAMLIKELKPAVSIHIFERLDKAAAESSDAWNNAGTGHSAFCELNYTPEKNDGTIDISKAIKIAESFEVSKQFWSYLIERKHLQLPDTFITRIPHVSFVAGETEVEFLRKRYTALQSNPLFHDMEYTEDVEVMAQWMPLIMEGRETGLPMAATRMQIGTDVNFGALTRCMFDDLQRRGNVTLHFNHHVRKLRKLKNGRWSIKVKERTTGQRKKIKAKFVFIGAGGGSLRLLAKSRIPEARGYGGFPVSGQWLRCTNEAVIEKHFAKVYGKAEVGSPPMSVPHLDTRIINGKKALLFGPYAGFSTKFLKEGSYFDLFKSIQTDNIIPMVAAGLDNIPLTRYLIDQVRQSPQDRLEALRKFVPNASMKDWELEIAGQRVQVIKKHEEQIGILEFGTEVISSADGTIAGLLGASPGASTAVTIMIGLLQDCFPEIMNSDDCLNKLREIIPSFGKNLATDPGLVHKVRSMTHEILGLQPIET